jgi:inositol oxygenase
MVNFRNYISSIYQERIEETYKKMLQNQTSEYVKQKKKEYSIFNKKLNIWNIIALLDNIKDESDPDSDLPQIIHAYQTALSIKTKYLNDISIQSLFSDSEWSKLPIKYRKDYNMSLKSYYSHIIEWDWFPLVGLIHDLGKILLIDEFGQLPQWSVVGDTFPINCDLSTNYVFYNKLYHNSNKSLIDSIYKPYCGFDKVLFSWGHDEYMASVLEYNNTILPKEAIYIIRFHSFYSWHTPKSKSRGYTHLASNYDWEMLPLLKAFQKADLYSKASAIPNVQEIKKEYNFLIEKYLNSDLIWSTGK